MDTNVMGALLTTAADPFLSAPGTDDEGDEQSQLTVTQTQTESEPQQQQQHEFDHDNPSVIAGRVNSVETIEDIMNYINETTESEPDPSSVGNVNQNIEQIGEVEADAAAGSEIQVQVQVQQVDSAQPDPDSGSLGLDPMPNTTELELQTNGSESNVSQDVISNPEPADTATIATTATATPMEEEQDDEEIVAITTGTGASTSKGKGIGTRRSSGAQKRPRGRKPGTGTKKTKIRGQVKEDEYFIEAIIDKQKDEKGVWKYFVKWWDWPSESNTWEPIENLAGFCDDSLAEFEAKWEKERLEKEARSLSNTPPLDDKSDVKDVSEQINEPVQEEQEQKQEGGEQDHGQQQDHEQDEKKEVKIGQEEQRQEQEMKNEQGQEQEIITEQGQEQEMKNEQGQDKQEQVKDGQEKQPPPPPRKKKETFTKPVVDRNQSSSPPLDYMEFDVMEECPPKTPKELFTVVKLSGILVYVVVWKKPGQTQDEEDTDPFPDRSLIKAEVFQKVHPKMVINFYEERMSFRKTVTQEQILQERAVRALKIAGRSKREEKENVVIETIDLDSD